MQNRAGQYFEASSHIACVVDLDYNDILEKAVASNGKSILDKPVEELLGLSPGWPSAIKTQKVAQIGAKFKPQVGLAYNDLPITDDLCILIGKIHSALSDDGGYLIFDVEFSQKDSRKLSLRYSGSGEHLSSINTIHNHFLSKSLAFFADKDEPIIRLKTTSNGMVAIELYRLS